MKQQESKIGFKAAEQNFKTVGDMLEANNLLQDLNKGDIIMVIEGQERREGKSSYGIFAEDFINEICGGKK